MASIIGALRNADYNLQNNNPLSLGIGKIQVHNATILLEKGYNIWTEIEPLIERWGSVEEVPDIDENDGINQND